MADLLQRSDSGKSVKWGIPDPEDLENKQEDKNSAGLVQRKKSSILEGEN